MNKSLLVILIAAMAVLAATVLFFNPNRSAVKDEGSAPVVVEAVHSQSVITRAEGESGIAEKRPYEEGESQSIEFGELGPLKFKRRSRMEMGAHPVDMADVVKDFELAVKVARNGDGATALALSETVAACQNSRKNYPNEQALEEAVNKLYAEHTVNSPMGEAYVTTDDDLSLLEESMRVGFEYCKDIDPQGEEADPAFWLKMSADEGYLIALDKYGYFLAEKGKFSEALKYYEMSWQSGLRSASGLLNDLYKQEGPGFTPDPILSAAYGYLHSELFQSFYMNEPRGPIVTRHANRLSTMVERDLNLLRPAERELVLSTARKLLAANDACCFGL